MPRRITGVLLGLSLLAGCGRNDQPTVRLVSFPSDQGQGTTAVTTPPDELAECPGAGKHRRTSQPVKVLADTSKSGAAASKSAAPAPAKQVEPPAAKKAEPSHADLVATSALGATAAKPDQPTMVKKKVKPPIKLVGDLPPSTVWHDVDDHNGRDVWIGKATLTAPASWIRERPPTSVVLAEFRLPHAQGDSDDAELTVTAALKRNPAAAQRLRQELEGTAAGSSVERLQIGETEIVLMENTIEGGDSGDGASSSLSSGRSRTLSATVFTGATVYLINCNGPEKTVKERAGEFRSFVQSLK